MTITEKVQKEIAAYYASGFSANQTAKVFFTTRDVVRGVLRRENIQPHTPGVNRTHSIDENYFELIDTEEKAYWLGFLLADGSVTSGPKHYALTLGLASIDRHHIEKFAKAIKTTAPITNRVRPGVFPQRNNPSNGKEYSCSILTVYSKKIVTDLCGFGVVPNKSKIATSWNGSVPLMRHYWRGVIDGDGSVNAGVKNQGSIAIYGTESVVRSFEEYLTLPMNKFRGFSLQPELPDVSGLTFCP